MSRHADKNKDKAVSWASPRRPVTHGEHLTHVLRGTAFHSFEAK